MAEDVPSLSASAVKGIALANIIVVAVLGVVVVPLFLKKRTVDCVVGEAMAAGVLLVAALTHLLPEANEYFADQAVSGAICIATFLVLVVIEQTAVYLWTEQETEPSENRCEDAQHPPKGMAAIVVDVPQVASNGSLARQPSVVSTGSVHLQAFASSPSFHLDDAKIAKGTLSISAFCLFVALGFHSVIEGLALGSMDSVDNLTLMIISIAIHKGLAGFALGQMLIQANYGIVPFSIMAGAFVLFSPIGVVFAWVMQFEACSVFIGIATAMAAGTFLFISCFELLPRVFQKSGLLVRKLSGLLIGAILLAVVVVALQDGHAHSHGCLTLHTHDDAQHHHHHHHEGHHSGAHGDEHHAHDDHHHHHEGRHSGAHGDEHHAHDDHHGDDEHHKHVDDEHDDAHVSHV